MSRKKKADRKKKSSQKDLTTKIILMTATIELIHELIKLINKFIE